MKSKLLLPLLVFTMCGISSVAVAESFLIQIAAHAKPETADVASARQVGNVFSAQDSPGITRYYVGPYAGEDEARAVLDLLRELGFTDAFVRQAETAQMSELGDKAVNTPASNVSPARSTADSNTVAWQTLSAERRELLVMLDGQAYIKEADQFIRVSGYAP